MHDERGHIAKKDEEEEEEEEEGGRDGAWWRSRAERARDLLSIGEENSANFRGMVLLKRGEGGGGGGGVCSSWKFHRRGALPSPRKERKAAIVPEATRKKTAMTTPLKVTANWKSTSAS